MAEKQYYIRERGRASGPYPAGELRRMAKLGLFGRFHEISPDGQTWVPADGLDHLFAAAPSAPAAVSPGTMPIRRSPPPSIPCDLPTALPSAASGVSAAAPPGSRSAGPPPLPLGPAPVRVSPPPQPPASRQPPLQQLPVQQPTAPGLPLPPRGQLAKFAMAQAISAGALLVFAASIPYGRAQDSLLWWWSLPGQSGGIPALLAAVYAIVVGLASVAVALTLRGRRRGWVLMAAASVGVLLTAVAGGWGPCRSAAIAIAVILPAAAACSIAAAVLRSNGEARSGGSALSGFQIAAGAASIALALGIAVAVALAVPRLTAGGATASAVVGVVLAELSCLCALAGGILSLVCGLSREIKRTANKLSGIGGAAALAALAVAAPFLGYAAVYAADNGQGADRFALVNVLRLLVGATAFAGLLAVGLAETLAGPSGRSAAGMAGAGSDELVPLEVVECQ